MSRLCSWIRHGYRSDGGSSSNSSRWHYAWRRCSDRCNSRWSWWWRIWWILWLCTILYVLHNTQTNYSASVYWQSISIGLLTGLLMDKWHIVTVDSNYSSNKQNISRLHSSCRSLSPWGMRQTITWQILIYILYIYIYIYISYITNQKKMV